MDENGPCIMCVLPTANIMEIHQWKYIFIDHEFNDPSLFDNDVIHHWDFLCILGIMGMHPYLFPYLGHGNGRTYHDYGQEPGP